MDVLMTLDEVAAYLRLSKDTIYRLAQAGRIPAAKLGTQWRFRKAELDAWIDQNKNLPSDGKVPPARKRIARAPRRK